LCARAEGAGATLERVHALVIDDDPDIRRIAGLALARFGGFSVTLAASGEEALGLVEGTAFDVILLDVSMPGIDGPETFARLQAAPATALVPVIFFTATSSDLEAERLRALGARGVVAKPFEIPASPADSQYSRVRGMSSKSKGSGAPAEAEPTQSGIEALIAAARAGYAAGLPGRVAEAVALAARSDWNGLRHAAHRLRGTAATYGFADVGSAIGRVEDLLLAAGDCPDDDARARVQTLLRGAEVTVRAAIAPRPP
jgi:two-component system OmpR family response regulator